jgi:hypothetical protein
MFAKGTLLVTEMRWNVPSAARTLISLEVAMARSPLELKAMSATTSSMKERIHSKRQVTLSADSQPRTAPK